jgi:chorismate mutase
VSKADGILVEVHYKPEIAQCDGQQSLTPEMFIKLIDEIKPLLELEQKFITGTTLNLNDVRRRIDYLDNDIIDLISSRINLVPSIIEYKKKHSLPIYQPGREQELYEKYARLANRHDINPELVQDIFKLIITEMRQLQDKQLQEK